MIHVQIHCACGYDWTQTRPYHYAGKGGYPLRCPACDGAGKVFSGEHLKPFGCGVQRL